MNGALIVDKPAGITSHDVVNRVRRFAGTRRVGHTGTLDPMATGALGVLIGPATRLSRYAMEGRKHYQAVIRLGETTTTYDAEGDVIESLPVDVDLEAITAALSRYHGPIHQIPPMYAAIKIRGRKLYELAREGNDVEREPRLITIYALEVLNWHSPDFALDVVCSSGTYIRSLAHDVGQDLGCGGHLRALRRTITGPFSLAQSHTLEELQNLHEMGRFEESLLPPAAALGAMPAVQLSPDQERAVRYGQCIQLTLPEAGELLQAHDEQGQLIAVLASLPEGDYRPTVVFPPENRNHGGRS